MNHPCSELAGFQVAVAKGEWGENAYHQVQTERVVIHGFAALRSQSGHDVETTGSEDNRKGQPETTVGGEGSSTESVTNSHFPAMVSLTRYMQESKRQHTTCQQATGRDHRNRKQDR